MYKVFYNQRIVFFIENDFIFDDQNDIETHYFIDKDILKKELKKFLANSKLNKLYVICSNVNFAFSEFSNLYALIDAAGGLVQSNEDEILVIYRRKIWDLPKGKIEKDELPHYAAVREVEEECGITNIELGGMLKTTYHTYELNGKEILKRTFWYNMCCGKNQKLKPQIEEEITEVKWLSTKNVDEILKNTFPSIIDVLKQAEII